MTRTRTKLDDHTRQLANEASRYHIVLGIRSAGRDMQYNEVRYYESLEEAKEYADKIRSDGYAATICKPHRFR